jgi:hypothetical protein
VVSSNLFLSSLSLLLLRPLPLLSLKPKGTMVRLPDEIIVLIGSAPTLSLSLTSPSRADPRRIAEHLDADRQQHVGLSHIAQEILSRLARADKRFTSLVAPILYISPLLASPSAVSSFFHTYTCFVDPWKTARRSPIPTFLRPEKVRYTHFPLFYHFL